MIHTNKWTGDCHFEMEPQGRKVNGSLSDLMAQDLLMICYHLWRLSFFVPLCRLQLHTALIVYVFYFNVPLYFRPKIYLRFINLVR